MVNQNQNTQWSTNVPTVPGLYWLTVMSSCSDWHTSLVCVSVESQLGGRKLIRLTEVTPAFVRAAPARPRTEERIWSERNDHMNEYFMGPLDLPSEPDKTQLHSTSELPKEPGLYHTSHYGNAGWKTSLRSISIHRAHGFADQLWAVDLPEFHLREVGVVMNTCYTGPFPIAAPATLPNGRPIVMPITK